MAITYDFLADNIYFLLNERSGLPTREEIRIAFEQQDSSQIAKLVCVIALDIRARSSTLPFPDGHEDGMDMPSRNLAMATHYLDEVGRALGGEPLGITFQQPTFNELGWHAFGAVVQAIAGILAHIEQDPEKRG